MSEIRAAGGGRKGKMPTNMKSSITRVNPPAELMGEYAVKVWKLQSRILISRGNFEPEDAFILLSYCNACHLQREAEKAIAEEGLFDFGANGKKQHPAVGIRNQQTAQIARLGSILGLDPLSRWRINSAGKEKDPDEGNEFDGF